MLQDVKQIKDSPLWYQGVCDELLLKISLWEAAYWTGGSVHSTRQWMDPRLGKPVDKPVKMAHFVPFRETELDHLLRIITAMRPGTPLIEEIQQLQHLWKSGKAVVGRRYSRSYWSRLTLPSGLHRVITVAFYPEHVTELVTLLKEAKFGKTTDFWNQQKAAGKELFEQ